MRPPVEIGHGSHRSSRQCPLALKPHLARQVAEAFASLCLEAEKVDIGAKVVDQAGKTMSEVISSVNRVAGIIAAISQAFQRLSAGIGQMNNAVSQMDDVTQQNAGLVEPAAAAATSFALQAAECPKPVRRAPALTSIASGEKSASGCGARPRTGCTCRRQGRRRSTGSRFVHANADWDIF